MLVEGAGLLEESLALSGLAANRLEPLDAERLAGLVEGDGPLVLLAAGGLLLGDDLPVLVLLEVRLGEATLGLLLAGGATEDGELGALVLGDFALRARFFIDLRALRDFIALRALRAFMAFFIERRFIAILNGFCSDQ